MENVSQSLFFLTLMLHSPLDYNFKQMSHQMFIIYEFVDMLCGIISLNKLFFHHSGLWIVYAWPVTLWVTDSSNFTVSSVSLPTTWCIYIQTCHPLDDVNITTSVRMWVTTDEQRRKHFVSCWLSCCLVQVTFLYLDGFVIRYLICLNHGCEEKTAAVWKFTYIRI